MSLHNWIRGILDDWLAFSANPRAWRAARKAKKIRAERKALSRRYLAAKKQHRPTRDIARRLDALTLMELKLEYAQ